MYPKDVERLLWGKRCKPPSVYEDKKKIVKWRVPFTWELIVSVEPPSGRLEQGQNNVVSEKKVEKLLSENRISSYTRD